MVAVPGTEDVADRAAGELATQGHAIIDAFIPAELTSELVRESEQLMRTGAMRPAQIGKGADRRRDGSVRGDLIHWFDPAALTGPQTRLLERVEEMRLALNRRMFLGLFDYEACHARYPEGSRYRRHRDRFTRAGRRILTLVTYLNLDWRAGDGGELRIHRSPADALDVEPLSGRAVIFLSDRMIHEVRPAIRPRLSVAGWFRGRP